MSVNEQTSFAFYKRQDDTKLAYLNIVWVRPRPYKNLSVIDDNPATAQKK